MATALQNITHLQVGTVLHSFVSEFAKAFIKNLFLNFWIALILAAVGALALLRKNKLLFAWYCLCCLGYYAAVCITFETYVPFHTESELMPLCIIMTTPFVLLVLPKLTPNVAVLLLIGIFIVRFIYIGSSAQKFIARTDFIYSTLGQMKKQGDTKLVFLKADNVDRKLILDWGLPFESAIADALEGNKPQANFGFVTPDQITAKVPKDSITMMGCFESWYQGMFNYNYFNTYTDRPYKITTYEEFKRNK